MIELQPDNEAAIEFLRLWEDRGPWVLTAISTDRKSITTRTFQYDNLHSMENFLREHNGRRNIYFHVNPVMRELRKKADREDIARVSWLHVDVDPREREDVALEQERIRLLMSERLPSGVPRPTCVTFSGGGYQAFWRLEQPIEVNGDLALAEEAKRYNQQLELLFGGDNCHNIDRIMRVPGTINIPDAKKLKKGRTEALAQLVYMEDTVHPISRFSKAVSTHTSSDTGFSSGGTVKVGTEVERLADVNELDQWDVPDRVKVIIVQGSHPEETKEGDNSRSAWLFDVACNLARRDVPDEVIFSILTDPDFGISESVLEMGSNAQKYALRQIERAKEEADEPLLRRLNEKHAVIGNMGGKCRVIEEIFDPVLKRPRLTKQSFDDIRNRYMNQMVQVGMSDKGQPIMVPLGKFWLGHQKRRQYESIIFAPNQEVEGCYNLWRGFACQSLPGDCSLLLDHIRENICNGEEELYTYFIKWMARAVQNPATPGEVAIVMRGGRGTGKGFVSREFGKLFGRHFLHISNPSHLVGNFNAHLRDTVVLFADEAFFAGDKKHTSVLKTLVTEDTITIEAKGVDAETAPNFVHLLMASNDQHVVPAGGDERRFLVLDVGKGHQQDSAYFAAISEQMLAGGREAFLHHLMTMDLEGFDVRSVPQTDALREQKLLSLSVEEEWWYQKLEEGAVIRGKDGWPKEVHKDALVDDYIEYTRRFNVTRRGNQTALGRFLRRMCPRLSQAQRMATIEVPTSDGFFTKRQQRAYFYVMPSLEQARARWEELFGKETWLTSAEPEMQLQDDEGEEHPF